MRASARPRPARAPWTRATSASGTLRVYPRPRLRQQFARLTDACLDGGALLRHEAVAILEGVAGDRDGRAEDDRDVARPEEGEPLRREHLARTGDADRHAVEPGAQRGDGGALLERQH